MEINQKLKNARINMNLTQEDVAEKIMISRQTISNWENGKSLPDIMSIINLSELYQISLDELLKGDLKLREKINKDVNNIDYNYTNINFNNYTNNFNTKISIQNSFENLEKSLAIELNIIKGG